MMRRLLSVLFTLSLGVGVGCTGSISGLIKPTAGSGGSTDDGGSTSTDGSTAGGTGGAGSVPTSSLGIPCAVDTILKARCQGCHAAVPVAGAPMPLVNLADFRAPAKSNGLVTVAQMVGVRINSTTAPMPPLGAVAATAAEIQTVTTWVNGGAVAGTICGAPATGSGGSTGAGTGGTTGGTGTGGATGTTVNNGLPCNIQTLLQTHCQGCHSNPPANGAPMPLMTYANLTTKSFADATMTFAQRAIARMQNTTAPMPPLGNPAVSPAEIAAMSAWVASQYPMGSCTTTTTGAGGAPGTTTGVGGAPGTTTGVGGAPGGPNNSGIPCNVLAVFQARCQGCHSNPPANGAPMPLMTLANLKAISFADPTMTFAQRALSRMQNTAAPMPPAPNARASAADIATVNAWVAAQSPAATSTASCGVVTGAGGAPGGGVGGSPGTTTGTGGAGGGTGTVANGLPCDVATLLQTRCLGCHTNPLMNGAPMPLLTYANLTATSFVDPTMTFAQRTVVRMTAGTMPPAPNAHATTTEIAAMSNWIAAKYPMGTCTTTVTGAGGSTGGGTGGAAGGTGGAGGGAAVGLPCDVQAVFQTHCTICHATTPTSGAPMPLVTRANLVAPSFANAAQTFAQRAVMRMQGNPSQMPPAPGTPPSATEIATVNAWVAAGYPAGTCGTTTTPPPPDPINARPICTSNIFWPANSAGSPIMNPGLSCLSCHTGGGGGDDSGGGNSGPGGGDDNGGGDDDGAPLYTLAGTVYPTGHEPDLCYGTAGVMAAARVVIVDAANRTITLTPNASGNFFYAGAVTFPFHAKVTYQGRERIMTAAQSNGSCNGCHTQNGANGAPGRITLP